MSWWHWLIVHLSQETGTSNASSRAYDFWSGFGSDLGEVALVGGIVSLVRQKNCHVHHCLRLGKHNVDGTPFVVCAKHHPDVPGKVHVHHLTPGRHALRDKSGKFKPR